MSVLAPNLCCSMVGYKEFVQFLKEHGKIQLPSFDTVFDLGIVHRDTEGVKTKPSGDGIRHLLKSCSDITPEQTVMIGDHADDVSCGQDAGAFTIIKQDYEGVMNSSVVKDGAPRPDFTVSSLAGLKRYL